MDNSAEDDKDFSTKQPPKTQSITLVGEGDVGGVEEVSPKPPLKRKIGRPKKRQRVSKPGPRKGDATILNEYRNRMLTSPKSRKVLDKVFEVALKDDHPHQAAMLKLVMDRIVPAGALANIAGASGGRSAITINITGIGEASVGGESDVIEGEFEEAEEV